MSSKNTFDHSFGTVWHIFWKGLWVYVCVLQICCSLGLFSHLPKLILLTSPQPAVPKCMDNRNLHLITVLWYSWRPTNNKIHPRIKLHANEETHSNILKLKCKDRERQTCWHHPKCYITNILQLLHHIFLL